MSNSALIQPGSVIELRAPKAGRQKTISGYFDDPAAFSKAATELSGKVPGVYATINPTKPALLARRANRVVPYAEVTTSDQDIDRRVWLPIDLDPSRPTEICSTDGEHEAAIERARQVRTHLQTLGWPDPVAMDSGNGAYLLYRIDMANDEPAKMLVERCLAALALRFDDEVVRVDKTMFNAARIVRVPDTLNCKGDNTIDRPHRIARILHVPDPIEIVPPEKLAELAGPTPPNGNGHHNPRITVDFDPAAFVRKHCRVRSEGPYRDGYRWILDYCPLHNEDVIGSSCSVIQWASGTLIFKCQHDRCAGRQWHDLLEKFKPKEAEARPPRSVRREPVEPQNLREVERVWASWMAVAQRDKTADLYSLHVVLGTYAANRIPGDPVWMMVVAGSGSGKTEAARSISGLPDVHLRSAITGLPALLSATPKKDRTAGATGGLLREVGEFGVIVLKDFTTILSMHREARAEILAALREIYDGEWTRSVGSEGARTLSWKGKVGLVAASTAAVDNAHAALSVMGSRFLFARLPDVGWEAQGGRAIRQGSKEAQMHQELAEAVRGLLENLPATPPELEDAMVDPIVEVANLASLARSPVERDYRSEIELVGDREAPTRIAKQLAQLYRGLLWIGMDERAAWKTVARVSLDSIPKLRRAVIDVLYAGKDGLTTRKIAGLVNHPKTTTERALEDLDAHGVVERNGDEQGQAFTWTVSGPARAAYTRATTEPEMSDGASGRVQNPAFSPSSNKPPRVQDDISGSVPTRVRVVNEDHDYQLVDDAGKSMNVGLFVGPREAVSYATSQGWEVVVE